MGSVSFLSLKEAREIARIWRRIAHEGGDPREHRDRQKGERLIFADAAERCWSDRIDGKLRSARSSSVWLNALRTYAYPTLAQRAINAITVADIKAVLAPIWLDKPETARKVRQRLRTIFDWARASGHLDGLNPTEGVDLALPRQTDTKQHFAALPWKRVARALAAPSGGGRHGSHRTPVRHPDGSQDGRGARRGLVGDRPRRRGVAGPGRTHESGQGTPCAAFRVGAGAAAGTPPSGQKSGGPGLSLGPPAPAAVGHDPLGGPEAAPVPATVHGFRSTFRDWAEDETTYSHEVKEAALAHVVKNRAEAAYRRTDLFEKRRALMRDWASFVTGSGAGLARATAAVA